MARLLVKLASLFFILLATGCMSVVPGTETQTTDLVLVPKLPDNGPLCCSDLSTLPYQPLAPDSAIDLVLDQSSPRYRFDDGLSLFAAYQLPERYGMAVLELRSRVIGGRVFRPTLMFLDAQFTPVRTLSDTAFPYVPARGLTADSLYGEIPVHQGFSGDERYLVIYSSELQQQGQTQLQHPAKAYAIAKGNVPPAIPDPVAEHSAGGYLQLKLDSGTAFSSGRWALWKETRFENRSMANPTPSAGEGALLSAQLAESASSQLPATQSAQVLPETEAFYRQQITYALDQGDLEKALMLGEEARRIGADAAREYLLQRLNIR